MKAQMLRMIVVLLCLMLLFTVTAAAAPEDYYRIDVLVIMDSSQSMPDNDPNGLRFQAFKDLVKQLEEGDRIGLIQFGSDSEFVYRLTEINQESREKLLKNDIPEKNLGYTDVKDALSAAYEEMQKSYDSEHLPFFIILTDGGIYPITGYDSNKEFQSQYMQELDDLAQQYKAKGWPVYAINLRMDGKDGDPDLKEFSESTGGYMSRIQSAGAINETFQDVLASIRRKKVEEEKKIQEEIHKEIIPELRVTAPDAGKYTIQNKMEIHSEVTGNGMRMRADQDSDLQVEQMTAEIQYADGERTQVLLMDDGVVEKGDMKKGDGIYSAFYTPEKEGDFTISVHVKGIYKGRAFEQSKEIKGLRAVAAGKVTLTLPESSGITLYAGKSNIVRLNATVQSERTERIAFILVQPQHMVLESNGYYLRNGLKNKIELQIQLPKDVPAGEQGNLVLRVVPDNQDTIPSPEEITIKYSVEVSKTVWYMGIALAGIIVLVFVTLIVRVLRKKAMIRAGWVKGKLTFWSESNPSRKQTIVLDRFKKQEVRLCSNPHADADQLMIAVEEIDIKIFSERQEGKLHYFATGGIDNVLLVEGNLRKTIMLEHGLCFRVKSYVFQYDNPRMKVKKNTGVNVLQKYNM